MAVCTRMQVHTIICRTRIHNATQRHMLMHLRETTRAHGNKGTWEHANMRTCDQANILDVHALSRTQRQDAPYTCVTRVPAVRIRHTHGRRDTLSTCAREHVPVHGAREHVRGLRAYGRIHVRVQVLRHVHAGGESSCTRLRMRGIDAPLVGAHELAQAYGASYAYL